MKAFKTTIYTLLFISFILPGCSDDDPSEQERVKNLLTTGGAWNLQSAAVDGVSKTDLYSGLTITFSSNGFTVTNGGTVWPSTGTWQFAQSSSTKFVRDDGTEITIKSISKSSMELAFHRDETTFGSGRIYSVSGEHLFVFSRP